MVHEEEKHDNELAVEGGKDDENEEVTEEQEHELVLGMVEVNYENEEHVTGEQLPLEMVNTDHDQNSDEQLAEDVEETTVQLEAVGNLDFIHRFVQSKLKYYHFIIPQIHPLSLLVLLRRAIIYKPSILERNQGISG